MLNRWPCQLPSGLVSSSGVDETAGSLAASFWEQWIIIGRYVGTLSGDRIIKAKQDTGFAACLPNPLRRYDDGGAFAELP
jgi:hypothetical protein